MLFWPVVNVRNEKTMISAQHTRWQGREKGGGGGGWGGGGKSATGWLAHMWIFKKKCGRGEGVGEGGGFVCFCRPEFFRPT